MGAYLTMDDYCEPGWGAITLCEDPLSDRSFWAAILQFATADGGVAIYYDLDAGEDCLAIEVDGDKYSMMPPPPELRSRLLAAARRLACAASMRSPFRWLYALLPGRHYLGRIALYAPYGDIVWDVYGARRSVCFRRASPAA